MTFEETIRFLASYRNAKKDIRRREAELDRLNVEIGISAVNYDGMPKSGKISSKTENDAIKLAEAKRELHKARKDAMLTMIEIQRTIETLSDSNEKDVLAYRYICEYEFKDIADYIGYSERQVYRFHNSGIENLSKMSVHVS